MAPSTAAVQGYLLVSDGPLTEPEVRRALGMSHRAASLALAQCEEWGLVERADAPRRSGQRGPAAMAWRVVDDHWEWFRRVAVGAQAARDRSRACRSSSAAPTRLATRPLARRRRRAGAAWASGSTRCSSSSGASIAASRSSSGATRRAIEGVFAALDRARAETVDRLWGLVGELGPDDMGRALEPSPSCRPRPPAA